MTPDQSRLLLLRDAVYSEITESAQQHGQDSEPDHEVGDLQIALGLAIAMLDESQLRQLRNNWLESQS